MTTPDQSRWYMRLSARGYRLLDTPSNLLHTALDCGSRDRTVPREAIADTVSTVLTSIREAPCDIVHEHGLYPPPYHSLCREEQICCVRTVILAFVGWLSAQRQPPPWLLRETHIGECVRQLVHCLAHPQVDDGLARARELLGPSWSGLDPAIRRIQADFDSGQFPDPRAFAAIYDALATAEAMSGESLETLRPWIRMTRALGEGGAAGLCWPYMFVALERARVRSWPPADRRLCGALECVADDVAQPICRISAGRLHRPRPPTANRRRIHDARRHVLLDPLWDNWAVADWTWTREERARLEAFETLMRGVL